MSDDIFCPKCKTSQYRNPSLKLMVNVCGHALCDNCVDLLFVKGSGSCPTCNIGLRRAQFRLQLFEDSIVEKDVDIRKRILKDFNKKEEDFETLNEYNDYLEFVETIIYNLTNNINVESTKKKIGEFNSTRYLLTLVLLSVFLANDLLYYRLETLGLAAKHAGREGNRVALFILNRIIIKLIILTYRRRQEWIQC